MAQRIGSDSLFKRELSPDSHPASLVDSCSYSYPYFSPGDSPGRYRCLITISNTLPCQSFASSKKGIPSHCPRRPVITQLDPPASDTTTDPRINSDLPWPDESIQHLRLCWSLLRSGRQSAPTSKKGQPLNERYTTTTTATKRPR